MIEANNLTMYYGPHLALEEVSFNAGEGEIVGLLGPNGAGKTTLMRIITTFICPTRGRARVCGFDITQDPLSARRMIGYLPETPPLYMDMRVDEYIDFIGRARGLSARELNTRKDWVIEAVQINRVLKHLCSELSLGYRQRVGLAQALIHDPKVIILDEPTSGLDPMQIIGIRRLIKELSAKKTIIFSTHILQEVSAVADRLVIISQGRIIAQGTTSELRKNKSPVQKITVSLSAPKKEAQDILKGIAAIKDFSLLDESRLSSRFSCDTTSYEDAASGLNAAVREKGIEIKELSPKESSLEDIFLGLFKENDKQ